MNDPMEVESQKSRLSEGNRDWRLKCSRQPNTHCCRVDDALWRWWSRCFCFKARQSHLRSPPSVPLKHTTTGPCFHKDFSAFPIERKQCILNTACLFSQSCSVGRVITLLTWCRAYGPKRLQTRCVCPACLGMTSASWSSLARRMVFVDTDRPSGARYSKLDDSIYTAVFRGIPYFLTLVCQTRSCKQISGPKIRGFCPCKPCRYLKSLQLLFFFR